MYQRKEMPGFLMYLEDIGALSLLTDAQMGALVRGLAAYVAEGREMSQADTLLCTCFMMLKTKLERDRRRYEERCAVNALNRRQGSKKQGAASAEAEKTTTVDDRPINITKTVNVTETVDADEDETVTLVDDADGAVTIGKDADGGPPSPSSGDGGDA